MKTKIVRKAEKRKIFSFNWKSGTWSSENLISKIPNSPMIHLKPKTFIISFSLILKLNLKPIKRNTISSKLEG